MADPRTTGPVLSRDRAEVGRLHETSCVIWQVHSQLLGWCSLAVFVGMVQLG